MRAAGCQTIMNHRHTLVPFEGYKAIRLVVSRRSRFQAQHQPDRKGTHAVKRLMQVPISNRTSRSSWRSLLNSDCHLSHALVRILKLDELSRRLFSRNRLISCIFFRALSMCDSRESLPMISSRLSPYGSTS